MSIASCSKLAPILLLCGCMGIDLGGLPNLGGGDDQINLTRDAVTIDAPRGYCIDPTETRDDGQSAFVLLGNCASISGNRLSGQPRVQAVLTAALSAPGEPGGIAASLSGLAAYFTSPDGRAVLSRTGDADSVTVLQSFVAGDVFFLRARDTSPGVVPGVQDTYWRAYFDIGPRIATLSVLALERGGAGEAGQLSVLETFVAETRAANSVAPVGPAATTAQPSTAGQPLFNSGFLRRIMGSRG